MSEAKTKYLQGETGPWEVVIGLEVHAQVLSKAKLFSGAATEFGGDPNSQVSFVDAAMPGMLPVINKYCVEQAVRTGLGLKAQINLFSRFDRKNYFYPDLPQGYQISQFKQPIVGEGEIMIDLKDGSSVRVRIERLHLEQDAGKSIHDMSPDSTFVDLNRSGVALMEIVSRPDMRSAEEAGAYVKKLRAIVRYLGTCDGNMDQGSLRADVNVSVRRPGEELGTRCEIKNVNSVRFIEQAILFEARRQIDVIEAGGTIKQQTRLFDSHTGETRAMRSKEEAHDYRYFPDPDLLPLVIPQSLVDHVRETLPELPDAKRDRFIALGLSKYDATVLVGEKENADYFEEMLAEGVEAKAAANWFSNEYLGRLNKAGLDVTQGPVSAKHNAAIVKMVDKNVINGKTAKDVLDIIWENDADPEKVVEEKGLKQVTDTGAIEKAVDAVIAANPDKVEAVRAKPKMIGWFVGQVMQATKGKANPAAVNEVLKAKLGITEE